MPTFEFSRWGMNRAVPFRFNPLEVQLGLHVQTHIDSLVGLFNAAFALVTPMPYVLSLALHRVYEQLEVGTYLVAAILDVTLPKVSQLFRTFSKRFNSWLRNLATTQKSPAISRPGC